ncbi:MAG: hypothetical protein KIS73_24670 [Enhydrobacter sp.]|nr:hypothetical protein [Enhydrobacter sp.]
MSEGAVLVGRLPAAAAAWEPMIVTTLRRYLRRGASPALLMRLAGGRRAWRLLNDWWNIDGSADVRALDRASEPLLGAPLTGLSADERRIAIEQLAALFAESRRPFPTVATLAAYFGVSRQQVTWDLALLEYGGAIADGVLWESRR